MAVNKYTFITDERFHALFTADLSKWTLQIKYVQERDAGSYECQISTANKISWFVNLSVVGEYREGRQGIFDGFEIEFFY